jgi:predicted cupin superfamily sugar epimerase
MGKNDDPQTIIARLGLRPHPEGGWFAETWREPTAESTERPASTAIYYLLRRGERSHWHRVDATEVWHFYAGDPLEVALAQGDEGPIEAQRLGPDVSAGERPQVVVPTGWWQAARPLGEWTLVGCTVAPGFRLDGFELAPEGWSPGDGR